VFINVKVNKMFIIFMVIGYSLSSSLSLSSSSKRSLNLSSVRNTLLAIDKK